MKSNFFYELYAANVVDKDGVYTRQSFRNHPVWASRKKGSFPFQDQGEARFMKEHRHKFLSYLQQNPGAYLTKIGNRFLSMTLAYKSYRQFPESPFPWLTILIHPLPFLSFLILFLKTIHNRRELGVIFLLSFYATFLIVYATVAFYTRYFLPLTPVLILMVYAAATPVTIWIKKIMLNCF